MKSFLEDDVVDVLVHPADTDARLELDLYRQNPDFPNELDVQCLEDLGGNFDDDILHLPPRNCHVESCDIVHDRLQLVEVVLVHPELVLVELELESVELCVQGGPVDFIVYSVRARLGLHVERRQVGMLFLVEPAHVRELNEARLVVLVGPHEVRVLRIVLVLTPRLLNEGALGQLLGLIVPEDVQLRLAHLVVVQEVLLQDARLGLAHEEEVAIAPAQMQIDLILD